MRYDYKGDFYELYQLDEDKKGQDYIFMNMDFVKRHGYEVARENYKLVYDDLLEEQDTLESLYVRLNIDHPEDFRGHSMSVSDVVVMYKDGEVKSYYVDSIGFAEVPEFLMKQELQKGGAEQESEEREWAYQVDNLYLAVQKITEGYGYIVYDNKYNSSAGDIYENPDVSLEYAVRKMLMKEEMDNFRPHQVSFSELFEKLKQHSAERLREDRVPLTSDIGLREKGLKNWSRSEIEAEVLNQTAYALKENGFSLNEEVLLGARVYGSRTREGLYREDSDINVVLSYQGTIEEERLQNMVNQLGLNVEGIPVNVKPISFKRSGSLAQFMEKAETVLDQKEKTMQAVTTSVRKKLSEKQKQSQERGTSAVKKKTGLEL